MGFRCPGLSALIVGLVLLVGPGPAWAGGVAIDPETVELSGGQGGGVFRPGEIVTLTAKMNVYQFGSPKFGYLPVLVAAHEGAGQAPTLAALRQAQVFSVQTLAPGEAEPDGPVSLRLGFQAPDRPGRYRIVYVRTPSFFDAPLRSISATRGMAEPGVAMEPRVESREVLRAAALANRGLIATLTSFTVTSAPVIATGPQPSVYLRVNGKVPSQEVIRGGLIAKPLNLSWHVGPEFRPAGGAFVYRYRLYPDDDDWSAWTPRTEVDYAFLQKGYHRLEVQARYDKGSTQIESRVARLDISLNQPLVAKVQTKGPGDGVAETAQVSFPDLYPRSRALLVGLWTFQDRLAFGAFDETKIRKDIRRMEEALTLNGFGDIAVLSKPSLTKAQVDDALAEFVNGASENDRLLVYFSTHGFEDPLDPSQAYLATSDCEMQKPTANCVRLNDLQNHARRALDGRKARQILFVVDSCFAGLGIVTKAAANPAPDLSKLAAPRGAFMLTAGMSSQKAQIDPQLGMSTFTHFLTEGLKGQADVMKGGVITLSELALYVQYEVARQTQSSQIPMMGRILGDGEMLFSPARAPD